MAVLLTMSTSPAAWGGDGRAAGGARPPMQGLLDRTGAVSDPSGVVNGIVANARWADLEPEATGGIVHPNAIDRALDAARAWNRGHPGGPAMSVKVRLFAGVHAPLWVKALDGPEIPYPSTDSQQTIGRFWAEGFGSAYAGLQGRLAAEYDDEAEIREVTISRCTTIFAEPFIRQSSEPDAVSALLRAGYTSAADEACQREQIEAHSVWGATRQALAFNPYQRVDGQVAEDGSVTRTVKKVDEAFTEQMMEFCRATLADACVLGNNSIRATSMGPKYDAMYARIKALGPPIYFQTASFTKLDDLKATLQWAVRQGANSVELPRDYTTLTKGRQLATWDSRLEANAIAR